MSFEATVLFVIVCCFVQGQYVNASGSEVAETGRSLVIVFDTTWSMDDDLQELRLGAAQIVKEMLKKDTNPIYNYVFVPFNDPCEYMEHARYSWDFPSATTRDNTVTFAGLSRYLLTKSLIRHHPLYTERFASLGDLFTLISDRIPIDNNNFNLFNAISFQSSDRFLTLASRICCCSTWTRSRCTGVAIVLRCP